MSRPSWPPEASVFTDLVEDVLRATPGLRYRLTLFEPVAGDDDDAEDQLYAEFVIETSPAHELEVSIELHVDAFRVRVNGAAFAVPIESRRRIERWIDRRCRDVEHLVKGDLKIEVESLFGHELSSDLFAGRDDKWVSIAEHDDGWGWIGLAAWLLPFGLSPLRTTSTEYRDWFVVD